MFSRYSNLTLLASNETEKKNPVDNEKPTGFFILLKMGGD